MKGNNGIAKAKNDTFYVASCLRAAVSVLEKQSDNTLVLTDVVPTGEFLCVTSFDFHHGRHAQIADRPIDNLSVDDDGVVWAAGERHEHRPVE